MNPKAQTIQELENDFWPDQKEYPSKLVERCHRYRKINLKDLKIHQIISLLIQDIGSEYLIPLVLERMEENILEEDRDNGSSFLESINSFHNEIFKRNTELPQKIVDLLKAKQAEIEKGIGWKRYEKILNQIEGKNS